MGPARPGFFRQQRGQATRRVGLLGLVVGGSRQAEARRTLADRVSIDEDSAQHLVLDLQQVAWVEKLACSEELVGDLLGVWV